MKKVFLFLLLIVKVFSPLQGKDIYFNHLTASDGLSQPSVVSIWQDRSGNMWFGNEVLNKYDGNEVKTLRLSDRVENVRNVNIKQICGDENNTMYILAQRDLIIYDYRIHSFSKPGIEADYIFCEGDTLFFARDNQFFSYHLPSQNLRTLWILPENKAIRHVLVSEDSLFVGTNAGLYVGRRGSIPQCILPDENISCIFKDSDRNLWVGTVNSGIRIIRPDQKVVEFKEDRPLGRDCLLYNNRIRCIAEDNNRNIWIGTYRGVTVFSPEKTETSRLLHSELIPYSLRHNSIYSIYKDKSGTMWVGSYYGGVSYSNPGAELYTFLGTSDINESMLKGLIIGNMTEDQNQNLYVATEEGGLNVLNTRTGSITRFGKESGHLPHNTIKSIWFDPEYQRLYVGTFTEGLWIGSSGLFREVGRRPLFESEGDRIITNIVPFDDEFILILTQKDIYKLNRKTIEITSLSEEFPAFNNDSTGIIRTLHVDPEGTIWISADKKGTFGINRDTKEVIRPGTASENIFPRKIISDNEGNIYFLMESTLEKYNKKTGRSVSVLKNENPSVIFYNAAFTPSNKLLLTSNDGITLMGASGQDPVNLSFEEAFPLKSVNASCGLYVSALSGNIYVGGINGMLILKEKDILAMNSFEDLSPLFFTSLSINNKPVRVDPASDLLKEDIAYVKSIKLSHRQNNLSISFSSANYINIHKTVYEYKLENFDKQWTETTDKIIRYTSLPPGKYMLSVREPDNVNSTAQLHITISSPVYASVGAYIIYGLLGLLLLGYILYFMQSNTLLKASLEIEHRKKIQMQELNNMKLNFFTNISHEFKTPLTLIVSQIDIALKNMDLNRSVKNRFLKIKKYTSEMQNLIDELMHFNKLEQKSFPFKASLNDITAFIFEIYNAFKEYAQLRGIDYSFEHSNEKIEVWFDPAQLRKVIYNLLSNAFKFTSDEGKIKIYLKKHKEKVEIRVEDNGVGINKGELENIFERFYQSQQNTSIQRMSGMGIGLALSKSIVEQHHGTIFATSEPNKGTSFTLLLPLGNTHLNEEDKEVRNKEEAEFITSTVLMPEIKNDEDLSVSSVYDENKSSVLIIEDNEELLELMKEAFLPVYNVSTASDGEEGLAIAQKERPDLVLTDIMIPKLSGLNVCKLLKTQAETAHIPVVLITAQSSPEQNIEGLKYGADDYIIKPFDLELLLLKCNNLIKNRKILYFTKGQTSSETLNPTTNSIDRKFMSESLKVIEDNLNNSDFDTVQWAAALGISRSKLFHRIKEITGFPPNEYLLHIKMEKAVVLLKENPNMTVAEIAYLLGFSSPGYFSKCFKDQLGITPLQYRNKQ